MTLLPDPDINLVNKLKLSADSESFNILYERYNRKVYNYCLAFTGNEDDAMDCTQEVFIRVFRNIGNFRSDSKFYTWLFRIMNNTCKDMIRKVSYRKRIIKTDQSGINAEGSRMADPASHNPDPHLELSRKEMHEAFLRALQKLKPASRKVIILRDIEGRSYQEISEITGRKPGTVRSSIARARYQLAEYLKPYRNEMQEI